MTEKKVADIKKIADKLEKKEYSYPYKHPVPKATDSSNNEEEKGDTDDKQKGPA